MVAVLDSCRFNCSVLLYCLCHFPQHPINAIARMQLKTVHTLDDTIGSIVHDLSSIQAYEIFVIYSYIDLLCAIQCAYTA